MVVAALNVDRVDRVGHVGVVAVLLPVHGAVGAAAVRRQDDVRPQVVLLVPLVRVGRRRQLRRAAVSVVVIT